MIICIRMADYVCQNMRERDIIGMAKKLYPIYLSPVDSKISLTIDTKSQ